MDPISAYIIVKFYCCRVVRLSVVISTVVVICELVVRLSVVISTVVVICELVCPGVTCLSKSCSDLWTCREAVCSDFSQSKTIYIYIYIYKAVSYLGCRSWTFFYLRWLFSLVVCVLYIYLLQFEDMMLLSFF